MSISVLRAFVAVRAAEAAERKAAFEAGKARRFKGPSTTAAATAAAAAMAEVRGK